MNPSPFLSRREREVLTLVAYEHSTIEIAKKLFISPHTVISHRQNIKSKMGVKNTAGLVRVGFETGVLGNSFHRSIKLL